MNMVKIQNLDFRCNGCTEMLKKYPNELTPPNIRFDNPVRLFKTDAFRIGQSLRP